MVGLNAQRFNAHGQSDSSDARNIWKCLKLFLIEIVNVKIFHLGRKQNQTAELAQRQAQAASFWISTLKPLVFRPEFTCSILKNTSWLFHLKPTLILGVEQLETLPTAQMRMNIVLRFRFGK